MAYDSLRASYDREHVYIVELELDYCTNTHGTAPCTATETGDDKCYNTLASCNDTANYTVPSIASNANGQDLAAKTKTGQDYFQTNDGSSWDADLGFAVGETVQASGWGAGADLINGFYTVTGIAGTGNSELEVAETFPQYTTQSSLYGDGRHDAVVIKSVHSKVYRFCTPRDPHPSAIDAIPCLNSVSLTPAKVDVMGGLGERSSCTVSLNDFASNDLDIDPYLSDRTYIATDRGTFFTKLRARNPNYQFRKMRVLTGYIENNAFVADNFKTRNYVIESMNIEGGQCRITGKDELKKAESKKALVPAPSTGEISNSGGISATHTEIILQPSGVGDLEYPSSGYVALGGSEIASFTRSGDTLTILRGQLNTTATSHDEDLVVQLCFDYTSGAEVNVIARDILVNYANVDPSYIDADEWQTEVDNSGLGGNLNGIIPKPTDVKKVLKELAEAKPHFIFWDELNAKIKLTALKEPPASANSITMDNALIAGSVRVKDLPEMRISTVYYTFGMVDPTADLGDLNNFTQTIVRSDTNSIAKYDSNQTKSVVSRWINSNGKATALVAAQLLGRRFANIPRQIVYEVDSKDNSTNLGDTRSIEHWSTCDFSGLPQEVIYQIIKRQEASYFKYTGIEYTFGDVLGTDVTILEDTVIISQDAAPIANLYSLFDEQYGTPTASTVATFIIESGVVVGGISTNLASLRTGTLWPSGATIKIINYGYIVGNGRDGYLNTGGASVDGGAGGDAIGLDHDVEIYNYGVIGGGGGSSASDPQRHGSGGAGYLAGESPFAITEATLTTGAYSAYDGGTNKYYGGDLGEAGSDSPIGAGVGGAGGKAIDLNGYTADLVISGDIRGAVS